MHYLFLIFPLYIFNTVLQIYPIFLLFISQSCAGSLRHVVMKSYLVFLFLNVICGLVCGKANVFPFI